MAVRKQARISCTALPRCLCKDRKCDCRCAAQCPQSIEDRITGRGQCRRSRPNRRWCENLTSSARNTIQRGTEDIGPVATTLQHATGPISSVPRWMRSSSAATSFSHQRRLGRLGRHWPRPVIRSSMDCGHCAAHRQSHFRSLPRATDCQWACNLSDGAVMMAACFAPPDGWLNLSRLLHEGDQS